MDLLKAAIDIDERRKRAAELVYVEERLSAWAQWAKEHRDGLGYPSMSLLYRAMRERLGPVDAKRKALEADRPLTAMGTETRVMREPKVGEIPDPVAEVDVVVSRLPHDLRVVICVDYFAYGPIEARAKKTRWKRARYSQLLESAKYAVYAALDSRTRSAL